MTPPWKSAGVRYTPAEWEARQRENAARRNQAELRAAARREEGRRLWAAGQLVPYVITAALNARGLDGPHVDLDCGAQEPDVDHWELGILYPTWEQTQKLAALCGVTVQFLCSPPLAGQVFLCGPGMRGVESRTAPPVLAFTQAALDRTLRGDLVSTPGGLW